MKWFFLLFIFSTVCAQAEVTHERVGEMIDQMVENNVISKDEAEKTKFRMTQLSPKQWREINEHTAKIASRSPASVQGYSDNKIEEVHGLDLDSAQFKQIQNDISKIVPRHSN